MVLTPANERTGRLLIGDSTANYQMLSHLAGIVVVDSDELPMRVNATDRGRGRDSRFYLFFFFILRRMGKNEALAHHTFTYFHTRRVLIYFIINSFMGTREKTISRYLSRGWCDHITTRQDSTEKTNVKRVLRLPL